MIPPKDIHAAKERLKIPQLAAMLGIQIGPTTGRCPFHDDNTPSFSIFENGTRWKCFAGCGGGDAIEFLSLIRPGIQNPIEEFVRLAGLESPSLPSRPKAKQQAMLCLPVTTPGTKAEHQQLTNIRRVSTEAVAIAVEHQLICFGQYRGRPAWFVRSSRNAQARRLDGEDWETGKKALTLPGSTATWPVGIEEAPQDSAILFCEGGGDALAGYQHALVDGTTEKIHAVCMLGAGQRIHEDALHLFAGHRVRVFPHNDDPGRKGAKVWVRQLHRAGAIVDVFEIPEGTMYHLDNTRQTFGPAKDLNDLHLSTLSPDLKLTDFHDLTS